MYGRTAVRPYDSAPIPCARAVLRDCHQTGIQTTRCPLSQSLAQGRSFGTQEMPPYPIRIPIQSQSLAQGRSFGTHRSPRLAKRNTVSIPCARAVLRDGCDSETCWHVSSQSLAQGRSFGTYHLDLPARAPREVVESQSLAQGRSFGTKRRRRACVHYGLNPLRKGGPSGLIKQYRLPVRQVGLNPLRKGGPSGHERCHLIVGIGSLNPLRKGGPSGRMTIGGKTVKNGLNPLRKGGPSGLCSSSGDCAARPQSVCLNPLRKGGPSGLKKAKSGIIVKASQSLAQGRSFGTRQPSLLIRVSRLNPLRKGGPSGLTLPASAVESVRTVHSSVSIPCARAVLRDTAERRTLRGGTSQSLAQGRSFGTHSRL